MRELGLDAYRFSIAWPRILPGGRGAVNQRGWISTTGWSMRCSRPASRPAPTLYHWDLPQALEDAGGWPNRDTAERVRRICRRGGRRARRPRDALDHPQRAVVLGVPRLPQWACIAPGHARSRRRCMRAPPAAFARRVPCALFRALVKKARSASRSTSCPRTRRRNEPEDVGGCGAHATATSTAGSSSRRIGGGYPADMVDLVRRAGCRACQPQICDGDRRAHRRRRASTTTNAPSSGHDPQGGVLQVKQRRDTGLRAHRGWAGRSIRGGAGRGCCAACTARTAVRRS